jgi:lysophospholipase L1-like esterase
MEIRRLVGAVAVCLTAICATGAAAHESAHPPVAAAESRWQDALSAFAAADRQKTPPPGGVLFIGSSSIRLWDNLETDFREAPVVIKRGFGGSRLTDCVRFLDKLVMPYRPRQVVVYAGDNDLAEGGTPQQVLERLEAFEQGVHKRLPETRVSFISIKPSPARRALIPQVRVANKLVRQYALAHPGVDYIDVFTPMLSTDGSPRSELFRQDALHLNEAGYALWRSIIRPFLH